MEDRQEYIARLEEGQAEAMERAPFGVMALVNPKLTPLVDAPTPVKGGSVAGSSNSAVAHSGGGGNAGSVQEALDSGCAGPAVALPGARFFEGCLSVPGYQVRWEGERHWGISWENKEGGG